MSEDLALTGQLWQDKRLTSVTPSGRYLDRILIDDEDSE